MIQIDSLQSSDSGTYGCSAMILDGTNSRCSAIIIDGTNSRCSAMILDGTNSRCGLMAGVKVFCVVLYHCPRSCRGLVAAGKQGTPSCYQ